MIENISIIVDSASPGLTIRDSGKFFELNNITITNINAEGNGLSLINVENGSIFAGNFLANGNIGIYMYNTNLTDVYADCIGNAQYGIYMDKCNSDTFIFCNVSQNTQGMYLANCTDIVVGFTYIQYNDEDGLYAIDSNDNLFVVESDDNKRGLVLVDSDRNNVSWGEFWDNTVVGVLISEDDGDSTDNLVYINLFSGNIINAVDKCSVANDWDNGAYGNEWDDYSGEDNNDDYIGDTPYDISGTAGAQDNFPYFWDGKEVVPLPTPDTNDDDEDDDEILLDSFYFEKTIILSILGVSLALFAIKRVYQK